MPAFCDRIHTLHNSIIVDADMYRKGARGDCNESRKFSARAAVEDPRKNTGKHDPRWLLVGVRWDGRHKIAFLRMEIRKLSAGVPYAIRSNRESLARVLIAAICPGIWLVGRGAG